MQTYKQIKAMDMTNVRSSAKQEISKRGYKESHIIQFQ
jgi:hypothetical protein